MTSFRASRSPLAFDGAGVGNEDGVLLDSTTEGGCAFDTNPVGCVALDWYMDCVCLGGGAGGAWPDTWRSCVWEGWLGSLCCTGPA